jgi:histidine triad (HIT) family protein
MPETIFDKIIRREIPADILYEDEFCVGFRDANPQAPTHVLVIPKKPISNLNNVAVEDTELLGHLLLVGKKIAKEEGIDKTGHRIVINTGTDGGQTVDHLHLHLIGGTHLGWPPFDN